MTGRPTPASRPERRPLGHPGLIPDRPDRQAKCIDLVERLTDYLDDGMTDDERARIDQHLETCADCTRVLTQWRTVIALAGRLGDDVLDEVAPATRDQLRAVFLDGPPTP